MRPVQRVSLSERVAAHLREGIRQGQWSDPFPELMGFLRDPAGSPVRTGGPALYEV